MTKDSELIAKIEALGIAVKPRGVGWCLHCGQRTMLVDALRSVTKNELMYLAGRVNLTPLGVSGR